MCSPYSHRPGKAQPLSTALGLCWVFFLSPDLDWSIFNPCHRSTKYPSSLRFTCLQLPSCDSFQQAANVCIHHSWFRFRQLKLSCRNLSWVPQTFVCTHSDQYEGYFEMVSVHSLTAGVCYDSGICEVETCSLSRKIVLSLWHKTWGLGESKFHFGIATDWLYDFCQVNLSFF